MIPQSLTARREEETAMSCSPPMVLTSVTAVLETHPVADPLNVPVAAHVCCTIVVTVAWFVPTLWERDVDVVYVVMVVYSVAVGDATQDMVPGKVMQRKSSKVTPGKKLKRQRAEKVNK